MKKTNLTASALFVALSLCLSANAQTSANYVAKKGELSESELQRWSHLDLAKDSIPGMSVDKAYAELLKGKKGVKVIVGVVDSGVDIDHEDLKSVVWTNKKEIPGNGIDDDKNGFIDDIHGWNFLGDAVHETLEMTRIIKKGDDGSETYKRALAAYNEKNDKALKDKQQVDFLIAVDKAIQKHLNKENYTVADLNGISTTDPDLSKSKMIMTRILSNAGPGFRSELEDYNKYVYDQLNYNLNKEFDGRKILGDNPEDITKTKYGNNVVYGPDKEEALHGTHVAGIIAQVRGNNIGGDGVADNVAIMAVRAVPDGDEYDKDIALAIRYAVDNGAKVINGSFGKSYSPHKQWVYDAIKYAEKKDVLFVHAAGNDGENIDLSENSSYPNDSDDNKKEFASNVLTVGALNNHYGEGVIAEFSNYGNFNVDVFAPGDQIYATIPNNKYKYLQGTSMAAPNAAGVAALIRSYYPKLKAYQVKQILMESGTPLPAEVDLGESQDPNQKPVPVASAKSSKSAKMVNAYNALLMAEKMSKK
ncbi:S8 family peptidase [Flavobacterium gilvum]|uniref:Peptidase S8 n=1 Tax=Flavobacterium gilvum TaxID=1492737 RepID=A0AAC9N505_9FLAO|nr:S8 family peptidase [Flavobacterium gilvum]AOW08652.1 peptidase S8 [Flavobacterium gilvum]KFC57893.1 peptidase S8 [Flavobacterium gilvum]